MVVGGCVCGGVGSGGIMLGGVHLLDVAGDDARFSLLML